jgi:hypothetical protein
MAWRSETLIGRGERIERTGRHGPTQAAFAGVLALEAEKIRLRDRRVGDPPCA